MCPQYTDAPAPTPSPAQGHDPGVMYHILKGLDVGKCHTKFQLSSPEGIELISCKRNADVNLHLNLQVNLNLVMNVTYAHTHATSWRNAICPTPAKTGGGIKIISFLIEFKNRKLNFNGCQMPHFMIVLIAYINLLNLSGMKKCLFLRNMEPLMSKYFLIYLNFGIFF